MTKANLKVVDDKKMDNAEKTKALDVAMSQLSKLMAKARL
jgi:hypothetical protein